MGYKTEKKIPSIILSVFIVLLILVGTIVPAYAAPTQDMMVTDSGEMLSDREEQEVSEMLYSINRQTGIEYLVYTIKSLNGEDIETCANRLFRTAGLGDKEKDNGLLLLISYDDRKFRLEVGYGLEGDIPDTQAANIINTMTPYFKEGNYGDGVKAAVKQTAVILNSSGEYTISEDWAAQAASNDEANQTSSLIAAGLVLGICYLLLGYAMIRVLEPGLEVFDLKYDIVMPEGFYCGGGKYDAEIMEEVGRKVIHLLEEIYGRKASPEIWALNNFKEFEVWYDANKKELEANARKKGPKGKTAAKMAA